MRCIASATTKRRGPPVLPYSGCESTRNGAMVLNVLLPIPRMCCSWLICVNLLLGKWLRNSTIRCAMAGPIWGRFSSSRVVAVSRLTWYVQWQGIAVLRYDWDCMSCFRHVSNTIAPHTMIILVLLASYQLVAWHIACCRYGNLPYLIYRNWCQIVLTVPDLGQCNCARDSTGCKMDIVAAMT